MFTGEFPLRLDEKGRLFLPAKFRELVAEGVMLIKAPDRCLAGFTTAAFEARTKALQDAPMSDAAARSKARVIGSAGTVEIPDRSGRITVPVGLRTFAELDRDVIVVGALNRLEIWQPAKWRAYVAAEDAKIADLDEEGVAGLF